MKVHTKNMLGGATEGYVIYFCAYPSGTGFANGGEKSKTGHMFVIFNSSEAPEVKGMHRAERFWTLQDWGGVRDEDIDQVMSVVDTVFEVWLPRHLFEQGRAVQKRSFYFLLINDCVAYASAVAEAIGLNIPSRIENPTPKGFIDALISQNP